MPTHLKLKHVDLLILQLDFKKKKKFRLDFEIPCRQFSFNEKKVIKTDTTKHSYAHLLQHHEKKLIDMQNQNRYIHEFIHLIASKSHHVPSRVALVKREKQHENRFVRCLQFRSTHT